MSERNRSDVLERRLADGIFYLLLAASLVLAGWLGARNDRWWDWTSSGRNTLTAQSLEVLASLDAPLRLTIFLDRSHPLAKRVEQFLAPYRRALPQLDVTYLDPQLFPEQARAAEVSLLGQTLLEYRNRRETVSDLREEALTAAIARLALEERPWIVFLEGHGERQMGGESGTDLGRLGQILRGQGYRLRPLDLTTLPEIPDNARLLVVSAPAIALFGGEADRVAQYLERGGNLLWLMDPGALNGLEGLANDLGITPLPGRLVDANVARLDVDDPTVAMVSAFPDHPLTRGLIEPALFPGSMAYLPVAGPDWTLDTPLQTLENSWNETGAILGGIGRDEERGEQPGPLPLALALTRQVPDRGEQRVLVVGDGDFLSNAHLKTAGNQALGMRMIQWLTDPGGAMPGLPEGLADRSVSLNRTQILTIGGGSLILLPLLFLTAGLVMRRRRSRE